MNPYLVEEIHRWCLPLIIHWKSMNFWNVFPCLVGLYIYVRLGFYKGKKNLPEFSYINIIWLYRSSKEFCLKAGAKHPIETTLGYNFYFLTGNSMSALFGFKASNSPKEAFALQQLPDEALRWWKTSHWGESHYYFAAIIRIAWKSFSSNRITQGSMRINRGSSTYAGLSFWRKTVYKCNK